MYRPYYLSPGVDHLSIIPPRDEGYEVMLLTISIMGDVGCVLEL